MKLLKTLSLVMITLLLITSFTAVKEDTLVGRWKGKDQGDIGFLTLSEDGFATFEMDGQIMGGKSFEMSGDTAAMKYSTDATTAPASIDFIIYEEDTYNEVGRLKGIYEMTAPDELHIALTFNGGLGRPEDFSSDNVIFYRVK